MNYLFTSKSVSSGHPDKVADQISDAILDSYRTLLVDDIVISTQHDESVSSEEIKSDILTYLIPRIKSADSDLSKLLRDDYRRSLWKRLLCKRRTPIF